MPKKIKSVRKTARKSSEKKSSPIVFIRRRLWLFGLAVFALLLSSQLTITNDFRTGARVLGIQENRENEDKPEVKTIEQQNDNRNETQTGNRIEPGNTFASASAVTPTPQFKFEIEGNKAVLKVEDQEGNEIKNQERIREELEADLEDEDIDISTEDGELTVGHGEFHANSRFPLSINPITHELTVTTPAGTKVVTVLPDAAVKNFLARESSLAASSSGAAQVASPSGVKSVSFTLKDNELVYEVKTEEAKNLFGFIPFTMPVSTFVSTENGQVVSQSEPLLYRLIGLLSF